MTKLKSTTLGMSIIKFALIMPMLLIAIDINGFVYTAPNIQPIAVPINTGITKLNEI